MLWKIPFQVNTAWLRAYIKGRDYDIRQMSFATIPRSSWESIITILDKFKNRTLILNHTPLNSRFPLRVLTIPNPYIYLPPLIFYHPIPTSISPPHLFPFLHTPRLPRLLQRVRPQRWRGGIERGDAATAASSCGHSPPGRGAGGGGQGPPW